MNGSASADDLERDLALALRLADTADAVSLGHFRRPDLAVEAKPDLTLVSEADRETEAAIRAVLHDARPDDAVYGEEYGLEDSGNRRRWIVDPIDGTHGYVRGLPVWATLVALEVDGELVVGVMSAPALGTRWWAARGVGAYRDGDRIGVSRVARVEDAHLAYSGVDTLDGAGRGERFMALARRFWRTRGFGDFWSYALLAEGAVDAVVEGPGLQLYDLAAPLLVVEEAGGTFTDLDGVRTASGGTAVATNGALHDAVLAALRP